MKRSNLVIVRAGDESLHRRWLRGTAGQERTWDLLVSYFGDDPTIYRDGECTRIDSKGPKWPALYELISNQEVLVRQYEAIWLPDDDLDCTLDDVNELFGIFAAEHLELAQPSLTLDSYITHMVTLHNSCFRIRYTSFVEIMAPCFSRRALSTLAPTFNANLSGWGLDFVWPAALSAGPSKTAVIDDVQVRHTRPMGSANYGALKARGITAWDEMVELLDKYGIADRQYRIHAALPRFGVAKLDSGWALAVLYGLGLIPAIRQTKWTKLDFVRAWLSAMWQQVRPAPKPAVKSLH